MKRQSIGIRGSSGESPTQGKESKRLKVAHVDPFPPHFDTEAGSGSDSTEEYINVNGQENLNKHSIIPADNVFIPTSPALDNGCNNYFNGSHQSNEYSTTNAYENAPHRDGSENVLNGSHVHTSDSAYIDPTHLPAESDSSISSPEMLEPSAPLISDANGSQCSVADYQCQTEEKASSSYQEPEHALIPENMLECNRDEHDSPPDLTTSSCDETEKSEEAPTLLDQSKVAPLQPEKDDTTAGVLASTSSTRDDIENITMCHLQVTQLNGHSDVVFCVDADEDFILSSSGDTTVKVWNVEEKKEISNFAGHSASVTSVILLSANESESISSKVDCAASRVAISASYDCHIRLWSVLDGHEISTMYTFNSIMCMGLLRECMHVVIGTEGGKLEVWDILQAKIIHSVYAHDSAISSIKIHDSYVYSTSKDGSVKVWLFDDNELQPLYTRRRKEVIAGTSDFGPAQWQAVAVHGDVLFLGDNTCCLKTLNWRIGRLHLFANQTEKRGICEAILTKNNVLLTSYYNPGEDTGGINVWRLPEMNYVGTLSGEHLQEICSLALTYSNERLRIISGGHQLLVWDFDFKKPPAKTDQDPFFVSEMEGIGVEVSEETVPTSPKQRMIPVEMEQSGDKKSWCNIS